MKSLQFTCYNLKTSCNSSHQVFLGVFCTDFVPQLPRLNRDHLFGGSALRLVNEAEAPGTNATALSKAFWADSQG